MGILQGLDSLASSGKCRENEMNTAIMGYTEILTGKANVK